MDCENCKVQGRAIIKKASRNYGSWGLCDQCYYDLKCPPVGSPRPKSDLAQATIRMPDKMQSDPDDAWKPLSTANLVVPEADLMPEKKDIDWAKVQEDRDRGDSPLILSNRYKCSRALIYTKTRAKKQNVLAKVLSHATDEVAKSFRPRPLSVQETVIHAVTPSAGKHAHTIALLRSKVDALNVAIKLLEQEE